MLKDNKHYIDSWKNKTTKEIYEFNEYIDTKSKEYIDLGLTVCLFRSGTFVNKGNIKIFSSREPIVHFMKFIDVVDEWLIHNN